jgi:serine/threonine protein phosphatase PrpC
MYITASHINIKLKQDYSDFIYSDDLKMMVICDGIGEFPLSNIVSEKVCEIMINKFYDDINQIIDDNDIAKLASLPEKAGTTIFFAKIKNNNELMIQYLGNGGCIHCDGSFAENKDDLPIYRFNELITPHVNSEGVLVKHLSNDGGKLERERTKLTYSMNNVFGDIFILFTDGINSNENNVIIKDDQGRYWRNESSTLMYILDSLNKFLCENSSKENFQDVLVEFNKEVLFKLNEANMIDDDASLGFVINQNVLNHYNNRIQ